MIKLVFLKKNGVQKRSVLAVREVSSTGFDARNTNLNLYANGFLKTQRVIDVYVSPTH
jgi:hypothetical protein